MRTVPVPAPALDLLVRGALAVKGRLRWSSNATFLLEATLDGTSTLAVYKPQRGERPLWDYPPGLFRRELAAYELSEALGWAVVPLTVRREDISGAENIGATGIEAGAQPQRVISHAAQVRQIIGQLHPAGAVRSELPLAAQQDRRFLLDEREADVLRHRLRQLLAMHLAQLRLGIEQVDVTRGSFGQEKDASLRFRGEVRLLAQKRNIPVKVTPVVAGKLAYESFPNIDEIALFDFKLQK